MKQILLVPEIRELLADNDLKTLREFCEKSHPETTAELLSGLEPQEIWRILQALPVPLRAEIFAHFDMDQQVELAGGQNRREMARLIEEMPTDDRADLVQELDESVRDEILPLVARAEREDIRKLTSYEEGTAGSIMTTDYAVLRPTARVEEALEQIRIQAPGKDTVYYIYVIDDVRHLIGFVSLKDLILARHRQTVGEIMDTNVLHVTVTDDQEEVARQIEKFDLLAIPVVTAEHVLVGIITVDDVMDVAEAEATEDIQRVGGSEPLDMPYKQTSLFTMIKKRSGWLSALFLGEMLTASAMAHFETEISAAVVLALFIPLIISSGGNSGSQAATLIIRCWPLESFGCASGGGYSPGNWRRAYRWAPGWD